MLAAVVKRGLLAVVFLVAAYVVFLVIAALVSPFASAGLAGLAALPVVAWVGYAYVRNDIDLLGGLLTVLLLGGLAAFVTSRLI